MNIHITLGSKGGIGKSVLSSCLAEYLLKVRGGVTCLDADPLNATLGQFKALEAWIPKSNGENQLDYDQCDELFERAATATSDVVVDVGASSFSNVVTYMTETRPLHALRRLGHRVILHSIIATGEALSDTLNGAAVVAILAGEQAHLAIWANETWGSISHLQKQLENYPAWPGLIARAGVMSVLPSPPSEIGKRDLQMARDLRVLLSDVEHSKHLSLWQKSRLFTFRERIFEQIADLERELEQREENLSPGAGKKSEPAQTQSAA